MAPAEHPPFAAPEPASTRMSSLLAEAWGDGTLVLPLREDSAPVRLPGLHKSVLPASLSGPARVSLAGIGERFVAWRVTPQENAPVIVRIPHVDHSELHQDLSHEIAALTLAPAGTGPDPIAFHDDPVTSPIGHPYVVTTEVPGTSAPPATWTAQHLSAHADLLAQLHTVPAPGRGPVHLGADPWAGIGPTALSLLTEVDEEITHWRSRYGDVITAHGLEPFLETARGRVAALEAEVAQLDGFVLAHGDLCATNIMWAHGDDPAGEPVVRYIDFEWACGDDPARDLAIIGGSVHGGPWYVPMDQEQLARFLERYVHTRRELGDLPASVADTGSLRERMRAWTAYERTAMLVHVASRAEADAAYRPVLETLQGTLGRELGLDDPGSRSGQGA